MSKEMTKSIHGIFDGSIQGIGFRLTVKDWADQLAIKGWVKNLSDGRVEIMAEGQENNLQQLFAEIKKKFGGFIREEQIQWLKTKRIYQEFEIRY